jgi:hypothetical protein
MGTSCLRARLTDAPLLIHQQIETMPHQITAKEDAFARKYVELKNAPQTHRQAYSGKGSPESIKRLERFQADWK